MDTLQKLKLDEFRNKIDEMARLVGSKAEKTVYDHKFVDVLQQLSKFNEMLADLTNDFNKNRQRVDTKLETLDDRGRQRTEQI